LTHVKNPFKQLSTLNSVPLQSTISERRKEEEEEGYRIVVRQHSERKPTFYIGFQKAIVKRKKGRDLATEKVDFETVLSQQLQYNF